MLAGAFILGIGVLIGAGIIMLCQHLGTNKIAAPVATSRGSSKASAETSPVAGAAKATPKVVVRTMNPWLRAIERRVAAMPEPERDKIMQKIHNEAY